MIVKFDGLVEVFNICVCGDSCYYGGEDEISVGGKAIAAELEHTRFNGPVTLAIGDERFTGELEADGAWLGYSEVTPSSPDELMVGPHNIKERLKALAGQHVKVWVSDEPVNVLE